VTYWFGSETTYARTVTESQYEYVGMTKAAEDTCLAAMVLAGHDAHAQNKNNGGGWKVIGVEVTLGAWA